MAHHCTVLSQILKLLPRHEFEKLANRYDGSANHHHHDSYRDVTAGKDLVQCALV
ncbi:MAG: DUF4372 domain-containing protein [Nitrosomonadaceae bacterium]